jgi:hypothetical protein
MQKVRTGSGGELAISGAFAVAFSALSVDLSGRNRESIYRLKAGRDLPYVTCQ